MSTLYLVALGGFCVAMLGLLWDAVSRVSQKPVWHVSPFVGYAAETAGEPSSAAYSTSERIPLVDVPVAPVEARHFGFVGLTNEDEFQKIA